MMLMNLKIQRQWEKYHSLTLLDVSVVLIQQKMISKQGTAFSLCRFVFYVNISKKRDLLLSNFCCPLYVV
jgi:hypothetical protein